MCVQMCWFKICTCAMYISTCVAQLQDKMREERERERERVTVTYTSPS